MANYTIDPVTGILIPTPGVDPGPEYATLVSNSLSTLAHLTHTGVSNLDGYQIPSAGINFNADISAQSNNLTALRSTRFTTQTNPLSGVGDIDCVYVKAGDLFYNNGSGTPIQITGGGTVNVTVAATYVTQAITNNLTIGSGSTTILVSCDSTSNTITITLPLANSVTAGRFYMIKDRTGAAATHNIIINPAGTDKIDGASSLTINQVHDAVGLVSDGSGDWLLFRYDRTLYSSGDAVTFASGSNLNLAGITSIQGRLAMDAQIVNSGATYNVPATTANTLIACVPTGAAITINLPAASTCPNGSILIIKDVWGTAASHIITINPNGTDNIEGLNAPKIIQGNWGEVILCSLSNLANNYWVML